MLLLTLFLIPLLLAWSDQLRSPEPVIKRRLLAAAGLVLLTCVPILSIFAIIQIGHAHGRLNGAVPLEIGFFVAGMLSIPFLYFGYRMTKWLGIASALLLPLIALLMDTLY